MWFSPWRRILRGKSGDTKPSGLRAGTKFVEEDTGIEYTYDPVMQDWKKKVAPYSAIVCKDGSTVWAEDSDGKTIASGEAGVDDASVIQSALDVGGNIVITKEDYIIKEELEISQRRTVIAYEATFRLHAPLKIYCKANSDWRGIVTPAPKWFGGEFFVYDNGGVEIGDGINIKFVDFIMQPKADDLDLLKLTTYQAWLAMCEISGSITSEDRETSTPHNNLNLVKVEKGTGDSTVSARAKLDLRLGVDNGNNNTGMHIASDTSLYDADVRLVLFVEGTNGNKGLFLDGYVTGTSFIIRGEGSNNATIIDIGPNATGSLKYNIHGLSGSYKILNNPYDVAISGMGTSLKFAGSLDIGLSDTYGDPKVIDIIDGFIPRIGFKVTGTFATDEIITVKVEVEYTDKSTLSIEKSYSAATSDYEWLTDMDYYKLHKWWGVPAKVYLYAKTNQTSTSVEIEYIMYGGGFRY